MINKGETPMNAGIERKDPGGDISLPAMEPKKSR
jgi:hypothetical protein